MIVWLRVLTVCHVHHPDFSEPYKKPFENIVGKGESFLLFPTVFPTLPKTIFNFSVTFILSSANAFNLDQTKILPFGNEFYG